MKTRITCRSERVAELPDSNYTGVRLSNDDEYLQCNIGQERMPLPVHIYFKANEDIETLTTTLLNLL